MLSWGMEVVLQQGVRHTPQQQHAARRHIHLRRHSISTTESAPLPQTAKAYTMVAAVGAAQQHAQLQPRKCGTVCNATHLHGT
jgi:hypothetical protein